MVRFSKNFFFLLYIAAITAIVAFRPFIDSDLTVFVFVVVGWMLSLGLHEFGHAFVAWKGGDYTMEHTAGVILMDRAGKFAGKLDMHEPRETQLAKLRRLSKL